MKKHFSLYFILFIFISCGSSSFPKHTEDPDFTISFGSCNRQDEPQPLWDAILKNDPDVFLWGGDNIYSDTDDPEELKSDYATQMGNEGYKKLLNSVKVLGTWDDHDYGLNDGGEEWHFKEESEQIFLDFFEVPSNSPRRDRKGVYSSEDFITNNGSVKVILLDTRYFRSALKKNPDPDKRYGPSPGTVLGETQWKWLEKELKESKANFNIILSSIQVLSGEHGFETWGNFPSEVEKLKELLVTSEAKNVIILSGDRHISEFSVAEVEGLDYPLMDFTSSGLTHTYEAFSGEYNPYRLGEVVKKKSFGILKFNFENERVKLEMRRENNELYQDYILKFSKQT